MTASIRLPPRAARLTLAAAGALALSGCNLPGAGPSPAEIAAQQAADHRFPFQVVTVTPEMVPIIADGAPAVTEDFVTDLGPQDPAIAPGDTIAVTIAEAAGGGLFSPPPALPGNLPPPLPPPTTLTGAPSAPSEPAGRVISLPPTTVGPDGLIRVPFAGSIVAAGRTPEQIAASIDAALSTQSLGAHATVRIASRASGVAVVGRVRTPGQFPVASANERVLDAIAQAGGASVAPADAVVQLNRFGTDHRVRLTALLADPDLNIHVRAGDAITVIDAPRRYTVLGAAGQPRVGELPVEPLTVAEALAAARGLNDQTADPHGVFLLRDESPAVVARLDAVEAKYARARGEVAPIPQTRPLADTPQRVAYRIDFGTAAGLFVARQMAVRDGDLLYVADADAAQTRKFFDMFTPFGTPKRTVQAAQ